MENTNVPDHQVRILNNLKNTEIGVDAILAEELKTLGELANLVPGGMLNFNASIDDPAQLVVRGNVIAAGKVVKAGENYGLQITNVKS